MRPFNLFALFIFTVFLQACNTGTESQLPIATEPVNTISFDSFAQTFTPINFPYSLPIEDKVKSEIDKAFIESFFAGVHYDAAFGTERDLPDLADNEDASHYFYAGKFTSNNFIALIIRKQNGDDNYYYLSTFAPEGAFINGMCVAFSEGSENSKTERRAAINDDFSLQLMQLTTVSGESPEDAETMFYEISADGKINRLKQQVNLTK